MRGDKKILGLTDIQSGSSPKAPVLSVIYLTDLKGEECGASDLEV